MSQKKQSSMSEEELKEFYQNLPEVSKKYLFKNWEQMNFEMFKAYMTGLMHGRQQVIDIVNAHTKRVDEILHK
jgi:hypothetical protein